MARIQQRAQNLPGTLPTNWWEVPGLTFRSDKLGRRQALGTFGWSSIPGLPSWAGGMPGYTGDPEIFYNQYRSIAGTPEGQALLPSIIAQYESTALANAATERGRQLGLTTLGGTRGRYESELERFRTDPRLAAIEETFGRRATGAEPLIGQAEQERYNQELSQSISRALNAASSSAASRGVAGGGINLQRQADLMTRGATSGVGLRAEIEGRNRTAQDAALESLGRLTAQRQAVESAVIEELSRVDAAIAALEAGGEYAPTDFLAFEDMIFGRQQYEEELRRADEERQMLIEQEENMSLPEWVNLLRARERGFGRRRERCRRPDLRPDRGAQVDYLPGRPFDV